MLIETFQKLEIILLMHLYVIVCKHECMCVYVCRYLTMNNIFIYVGMYVFRYVNMFFGIILYIASF